MTSKQRRMEQIKSTVRETGSSAIKDLAKKLGVAGMTIRRDLSEIAEAEGFLLVRGTLFYTGKPVSSSSHPYSSITAKTEHAEQKTRIARAAIGLLEPGDSIIIDAGSTTEYFVNLIPADLELSVFCFSLNILMCMLQKHNARIMLTGGLYHSSSMMFESREAIKLLRNSRSKKAFISASGFNLKLGITCSDDFESELKRTAIQSAQERILLVDSSKFGKIQTGFFAEVKDFERIITDDGAPADMVDAIRDLGVIVDVV
jgi:DeoR family transcriptional regulator, deoxyribose operon repressor